MKNKVICLFFVAVFVLSLCGCKGYREADNTYIVTAIGFDGKEKIKVSVEVVTAGGSERSDDPTSEIISGEGDTPMDAVFSLNNQITKNLLFDHCAAIIIGKSLNENHLGEVLKYGNDLKELNFAVDMFVCDDANKLFKDSESVSVSRGFDITSNLKETNKEIGIDFQNKFYEVYMAYRAKKNYNLPYIKVIEKRIVIDGQSVYNQKSEKAFLSNEDAIIYSFITNNNVGGKIYFKDIYADISSSKCKFDKEKGEYKIELCVKSGSDDFSKIFKEKAEKMLADNKEKLGLLSDKISVEKKEGI